MEKTRKHQHEYVIQQTQTGFERGWHWERKLINAMTFCKSCGDISDERILKNREEINIEAPLTSSK
jgi:hypothetical protein